jgi:hypothetical protein
MVLRLWLPSVGRERDSHRCLRWRPISIAWATACAAQIAGSSSMARAPEARRRDFRLPLEQNSDSSIPNSLDLLRPGRDHALDGSDHVLQAAEPKLTK